MPIAQDLGITRPSVPWSMPSSSVSRWSAHSTRPPACVPQALLRQRTAHAAAGSCARRVESAHAVCVLVGPWLLTCRRADRPGRCVVAGRSADQKLRDVTSAMGGGAPEPKVAHAHPLPATHAGLHVQRGVAHEQHGRRQRAAAAPGPRLRKTLLTLVEL